MMILSGVYSLGHWQKLRRKGARKQSDARSLTLVRSGLFTVTGVGTPRSLI